MPTNLDLALKFACESGGAPAELGSAVTVLSDARGASGLKGPLDLCDFTTSGYRDGFCVRRDERIAKIKREAQKAKAIAGLPAKELAALERAAQAFFEARTQHEVDLSGTRRAAFQLEEEARLANEYVAMLEKLREPAFEPSAPRATEAELNATHARLVACKELGNDFVAHMGFSHKGSKATQKQWRLYREAWIALITKIRPASVNTWRSWLTDQRLQMLESIPLCEKR